ncbi:hypothetical protein ACRQ5Q_09800 [Bradyrhizobium sp. PMVTL-01]|uniref:hypothetical protein n=1 Tax=Bradyrhizobium sp. PMVTL-01 TaxID=3434999 RepID=UPI003F7092AE
MITRFHILAALLTFAAVTGGILYGFMSTCFVSGLALTTFIAGSCAKRVFVYRAHREMIRLVMRTMGSRAR